jgi:hypothetical protein
VQGLTKRMRNTILSSREYDNRSRENCQRMIARHIHIPRDEDVTRPSFVCCQFSVFSLNYWRTLVLAKKVRNKDDR